MIVMLRYIIDVVTTWNFVITASSITPYIERGKIVEQPSIPAQLYIVYPHVPDTVSCNLLLSVSEWNISKVPSGIEAFSLSFETDLS